MSRTKILGHKDREEKLIDSVETAKFNWTKAQELLELHGISIISTQIRSNYEAVKNRQNKQTNGVLRQICHRKLFIDIVYECNFDGLKILKRWKEVSGQEQDLHFIATNFLTSYRKLKRKLIIGFVRKKKLYLELHPIKSSGYTTLKLLSLKFKEQSFEDFELQNMTKAAISLEKLLKLYESRMWYERCEFYQEFSQITNRRDATNLLDKIRYLDNLINLRQKQNLENQSNNSISKYLSDTSAYSNLYQHYNSVEDIDAQYKMKFNDLFQKPKTINEQSQFVVQINKSQKGIQTKNGRILNQKKTTNCQIFDQRTRMFNQEHEKMLKQLEQEESDDIDGLFFQVDEEKEKEMEQNKELTEYITRKLKNEALKEKLQIQNK